MADKAGINSMTCAKRLAVAGTKWSKRWGLVSLACASLVTSVLAAGKPPVTSVHLSCVEAFAASCETLDSEDGQVLVESSAILTDAGFANVQLMFDGPGEQHFPILVVEFSRTAAETLWETTQENIGRKLIFVADKHVISDANILEPMRSSRAQISLNLSGKEAQELVARILASRQDAASELDPLSLED